MRPVILVSSCRKDADNHLNQAIRETWGKNSAIPFFFILGQRNPPGTYMPGEVPFKPAPDEIVLPVADNYLSLPFKTKEGHRWARKRGYDYIFQCFTDTYIDTERLLNSGFEKGDYVGNKGVKGCRGCDFVHGGPGYWLSPRATDLILAADIGSEQLEDQWVALVMARRRVPIVDDSRYSMGSTYSFKEAPPLPTNHQISCHLSDSGHKYEAPMMFAAQRLRLTGQ
jgi:hypothetical protein